MRVLGVLGLVLACQSTPDTLSSDIRVLELGVATNTTRIEFELSSVAAFMIVIEGQDDHQHYVSQLTGPRGALVAAEFAPDVLESERLLLGRFGPQFKSINPVLPGRGVSAALFPNGDAAREHVVPGRYVLEVGVTDAVGRPVDAPVDVRLFVRDTVPDRGVVDLNLYFASELLRAEDAAESELINDAIAEFERIFAQASINVQSVRFRNLPTRYGVIQDTEGEGDLHMLFDEGARRSGLHVFLIDEFEDAITGNASGIPGAVGMPGGVAVALDRDPAQLGRRMAHESCHWLGIFHPSQSGLLVDPIEDTPVGLGEERNLMFAEDEGGTELTAGQARVLRAHPEVRPW